MRGNLTLDDLPETLKRLPGKGKNVVVIDGSDISTDCVRTASRLQIQDGFTDGTAVGCCRGTESEIRAREDDHKHAKEEGVHYEFWATPIRFIGGALSHVRQIEMQQMRS